jgi:hypothetical protein
VSSGAIPNGIRQTEIRVTIKARREPEPLLEGVQAQRLSPLDPRCAKAPFTREGDKDTNALQPPQLPLLRRF